MINSFKNFFSSKEILIILLFSILVKIPDINIALRGDIETYILMGDSYLKGEFHRYFDNKSQFVTSIYASILYLSGNDLRVFQLYGIILIFISGFLIGKVFNNKKNSLLAAITFIFFSTLFNDGGNYIMTEHIVIIPILISYLILIKEKVSKIDFFVIGLMLSLSSLIRQNFLILHLALTLYLLIKINKNNFLNFIFFCFGSGLIWILFLIIIYNLNGFEYLITNYLQPITDEPEKGYFFNFYRLILFGLHIHNFNLYNYENVKIINSLFFYTSSFIFFLINLKFLIKKNNILLIYLFSISLGIFFTGSISTHYLIQIMPFLTILIFQFLPNKKFVKKLIKINVIFFIIVLVVDYNSHFIKKTKGTYQDFINLTNWINNNLDPAENIYLYRGHSAYIKIKQEPLTKHAHPPNIFKSKYLKYINKDKNYTPNKEWKNILKYKPKAIVLYTTDDFDNFLINVDDIDFSKNINLEENTTLIGIYKILKID